MKKLIISLLFVLGSIRALGMEKPDANIAAKTAGSKIASLRDLAAQSCIAIFDSKAKNSIAQLQLLRAKAQLLPFELKERLKTAIICKHAAKLEQINNAKPVQLSDKEIYGESAFKISPDSQYLCYIAQKRFPNNQVQWPVDTLVLIHMPTGTQECITHPNLSCNTQEARRRLAQFTFTPDSKEIIFHDAQTQSMLYSYDIAKKKLSSDLQLSHKTENFIVTPKHIIGSMVVSPILNYEQNYFITHQPTDQQITVHGIDGKPLFSLPHCMGNTNPSGRSLAQFSPSGSMIATIAQKTIMLWDIPTKKLLKKIMHNENIEQISFVDENTLVVEIFKNYNSCFDLLRTDIPTRNTQLMARDICSLDHIAKLSVDAQLYAGKQRCSNEAKNRLLDCTKCTCIKEYPQEPYWLHHAMMPDASAVIIKGYTYLGSLRNRYIYPFLYYTHRAITNQASLDQLLALLIAEKQKLNKMAINPELINTMGNSPSRRLQEIARERYTTDKSFFQKLLS